LSCYYIAIHTNVPAIVSLLVLASINENILDNFTNDSEERETKLNNFEKI